MRVQPLGLRERHAGCDAATVVLISARYRESAYWLPDGKVALEETDIGIMCQAMVGLGTLEGARHA